MLSTQSHCCPHAAFSFNCTLDNNLPHPCSHFILVEGHRVAGAYTWLRPSPLLDQQILLFIHNSLFAIKLLIQKLDNLLFSYCLKLFANVCFTSEQHRRKEASYQKQYRIKLAFFSSSGCHSNSFFCTISFFFQPIIIIMIPFEKSLVNLYFQR